MKFFDVMVQISILVLHSKENDVNKVNIRSFQWHSESHVAWNKSSGTGYKYLESGKPRRWVLKEILQWLICKSIHTIFSHYPNRISTPLLYIQLMSMMNLCGPRVLIDLSWVGLAGVKGRRWLIEIASRYCSRLNNLISPCTQILCRTLQVSIESVNDSYQNEVNVATNKSTISRTVKNSLPSMSSVFLSERRRKVTEAKRLLDLNILEDAEHMHLHLMKSIENMNKLSSSLNILAHYSVRVKDQELVRSGLECGQLFICCHNTSNQNIRCADRKTKRYQGHIEGDCRSIRCLSLSAFLKEYEDLKVKVSRMRDLQQPSILHDRGFSISARRDVTHINFDSSIFRRVVERRQTKKELPNYSRFYISSKNCAEGMDDWKGMIMREDSLSRAFLHSNRLLSNLQRKWLF